MNKPTKALLVGIACGLVVAVVGLTNTYRLERKVEGLRATCVAEWAASHPDAKTSTDPKTFTYEEAKGWGDELVCDPNVLVKLADEPAANSVGIQGQLAEAQRALDSAHTREWLLLGGAIALALSLPWLWYFLLDRIKELRQALVGK